MDYGYLDQYGQLQAHDNEEKAKGVSVFGKVVAAELPNQMGRITTEINGETRYLTAKAIPKNFNGDYINALVDPNYNEGYEVKIWIDDYKGKLLDNADYPNIIKAIAEILG